MPLPSGGDDAPRLYTMRYGGAERELAVWLGTPAPDIEYAVRRLFAMPLAPPLPALLFSAGSGTACALSSHAPSGTVFDIRVAADPAAPAAAGGEGAAADSTSQIGWSAFGVTSEELRWDRFRTASGALPAHLSTSYQFCVSRAEECRDGRKPYVDTEPCSLEVPEPPRPQQISSSMRTKDQSTELEIELLRLVEDAQRKNAAVAEVLSKVYMWRRPSQYAPEPTLFPGREGANNLLAVRPPSLPPSPWAPAHLPLFARNSTFRDTFWVLALAAVISCPAQLQNIVVSVEHADVGLYSFQFSQDDETFGASGWRCVQVDDSVPCGEDLRPVLSTAESREELWPVLLHKAYAKFLGSYSHLHVGDTALVMRHLTGVAPDVVDWDAGCLGERASALLWWRCGEAVRMGLHAIVMRKDPVCPVVDDVFRADERRSTSQQGARRRPSVDLREAPPGLNWHAGALLTIAVEQPVGQGRQRQRERLLKLRNTYGGFDWAGDWSDSSPLWTKDMRERLGHRQVDDHVTWMRLADLAKEYDTLLVQPTYDVVDAAGRHASPPAAFFRCLAPCPRRGALCERAHQYFVSVTRRGTDAGGGGGDDATLTVHFELSQPELPEPPREEGAPPSSGPKPVLASVRLFLQKAPGELVPVVPAPLEDGEEEPAPAPGGEDEEGGEVSSPPARARDGVFAASAAPVELLQPPPPSRQELKQLAENNNPKPGASHGGYLQEYHCRVPCGDYVAVVLQGDTDEELNYCLFVSARADSTTGLGFRAAEGGSFADPLLPGGPASPREPMSPNKRLIETNPVRRTTVTQYV